MDESDRLRRDPVTGKLVIVAPERHDRPGRPRPHGGDAQEPRCPFCSGNESMTPPEVDALRAEGSRPDAPGWRVRVVPNLYPALSGGHEVIVHSPDHTRELEELEEEAAAAVIEMYRRRLDVLLARGAAAVTIICNRGAHAGASLEHPHSQVFALPVVPPLVIEELADLERYRNRYGDCLLCLQIEGARRDARVVVDDQVVAWVPDAPRWNYELRLAPVEHQPDFRGADVGATSRTLRRALTAVGAATGGAPLNYWLHTVPPDHGGGYHWHLELAPRTSIAAGFEFSTDMTIVEVAADAAAERLRRALAG
jgi:UDPglucose--hexose-1-phosphate uridylyltransferase